MGERIEDEPFWINPLGLEEEPDAYRPQDIEMDQTEIEESIDEALKSVRPAIMHSQYMMEFMKKTFPSVEMESIMQNDLFKFLKFPGAELNPSQSISNLPIVYNCLQRHAVALEEMILSKANENFIEDYFQKLEILKQHLVQVLCSLYLLIFNLKLSRIQDVRREILPRRLKDITSRSDQMIRDVIVLKEHFHLLQTLSKILSNCSTVS